MNVKTVRHFPRFGGVGYVEWMDHECNKSFVDSFIVGQFQTRSITELVDKATLILYILNLSISSFIDFLFLRLKTEKEN
jgi:hypothetical protein